MSATHGGPIAAYSNPDGTLLNASSEKTLIVHLARRRPWRILGAPWLGRPVSHQPFAGERSTMLLGTADIFASWNVLERYSGELAEHRLKACVPPEAWQN